MSNKFRGEVAITLDGQDLVLRPTWDAMVEIEQRCGCSILELRLVAAQREQRRLRNTEIGIVIWAGLTGAGTKWTLAKVGAAVAEAGPINFLGPVGELLDHMLTGGSAPDPEAKAAESA